MAPVLKTGDLQGSGGSNPSPSANLKSTYSEKRAMSIFLLPSHLIITLEVIIIILEVKMSKLIIIGNGFDLAHKIPTSYNDFRRYLIDKYPDAYRNKDRIIDIDEINDMKLIAVELMLYAIDHANGEDWSNFESSLSIINFQDKFPRHEHRADPVEDNSTAAEYLIYMFTTVDQCGPARIRFRYRKEISVMNQERNKPYLSQARINMAYFFLMAHIIFCDKSNFF